MELEFANSCKFGFLFPLHYISHMSHKAGFVSIIGRPNAGKSTLMNQLVHEKLSIITNKAQTTRHRIMGILSGDDFQIVYSDTPGLLEPKYKLQESMMHYVHASLEDADVVLLVVGLDEKYDEELLNRVASINVPIIFVLNKCDLSKGSQSFDKMKYWRDNIVAEEYISISALNGEGIDVLFQSILSKIPEHPAYYPKDELTDKSERFLTGEIIREKILELYSQEVPYSCEVEISEFKVEPKIIRIRAEIYVERKSQKGILIGKAGEAIKKLGTESRKDLETFFEQKVFLETFVKVAENWRKDDRGLKRFGYKKK